MLYLIENIFYFNIKRSKIQFFQKVYVELLHKMKNAPLFNPVRTPVFI